MLCPYCGWEAREVKLKAQYCRDVYTCGNGVCEMCNVVFTIQVIGLLAKSGEDACKDEATEKEV